MFFYIKAGFIIVYVYIYTHTHTHINNGKKKYTENDQKETCPYINNNQTEKETNSI